MMIAWNFETNNLLATLYNCIFLTYYFVCFTLLNVNYLCYYGSIHGWGTQKINKNFKDFLKLIFTNNIYMKQI
jgi:hypothetical protein